MFKRFFVIFVLSVCLSSFAHAATLQFKSGEDVAMDEVAVGLVPKDLIPNRAPHTAEISQKDYQFHPHITIVQKGDRVNFPNKDTSHHNVYSFSEAKRFDFKLFRGQGESVTLDKTGVITVGCNIHDWMLSYVVIVDTPYYALADKSGRVTIPNVPAGEYELMVWHPGLSVENGPISQGNIRIPASAGRVVEIPAGQKHKWPRKPHFIEKKY